MNPRFLPGLLILALAAAGCTKEGNCPDDYDMGAFEMLENSESLFPYDPSQTKAIFSDSLGNEYAGMLSEIETGLGDASHLIACPDDPEMDYTVFAKVEFRSVSISVAGLDLTFTVVFRAYPDMDDYEKGSVADVAIISQFDPSSQNPNNEEPLPQIFIALDERTWTDSFPQAAEPAASLVIHGKEFTDVYSSQTSLATNQLFFTFQQGMVGFKDLLTGMTYKLERIE